MLSTHPLTPRSDPDALGSEEKEAFRRALQHFIADVSSGRFRTGLRVEGVKGARGVYEMTWAPNGRATFQYGSPEVEGEVHVIWRRIGTHEVFDEP